MAGRAAGQSGQQEEGRAPEAAKAGMEWADMLASRGLLVVSSAVNALAAAILAVVANRLVVAVQAAADAAATASATAEKLDALASMSIIGKAASPTKARRVLNAVADCRASVEPNYS